MHDARISAPRNAGVSATRRPGVWVLRTRRQMIAGSTIRVNAVAVIKPPMTTMARGFCISAPEPCASAIGTKPSAGPTPVMKTALAFSIRPSTMARSSGRPILMRWRMPPITTSPLSTATLERQMNPTAAETENGIGSTLASLQGNAQRRTVQSPTPRRLRDEFIDAIAGLWYGSVHERCAKRCIVMPSRYS